MNEAFLEAEDHPSAAELAALAEEGASGGRLVEHLARCSRCLSTYGEFLHARQRWLTGGDAAADLCLVALGDSVLRRTVTDGRSRGGRSSRSAVAVVVAVAAAAALVAVVLPRAATHRHPLAVPSAEQRAAIVAPMRADAYTGLTYGDEWAPRPRGTRGGGSGANAAIAALIDAYDRDPASADVAWWLVAGLLSSGRVEDAEPYLLDALHRFPGQAGLHNLAAIYAYKRSDLVAAEEHARAALALDRSAATLVNLAIVRHARGFDADARAILADAHERFPDSALAAHADSLMRAFSGS